MQGVACGGAQQVADGVQREQVRPSDVRVAGGAGKEEPSFEHSARLLHHDLRPRPHAAGGRAHSLWGRLLFLFLVLFGGGLQLQHDERGPELLRGGVGLGRDQSLWGPT